MTGIDAGKLIYQVQADMTELRKQLNQIQSEMGKTGKSGESSFGGIKTASVAAAAAVGVAVVALKGIVSSGLKAAGAYEKQAVAFGVMLGSSGKAQKMLKEIQDFAASTPLQGEGLERNALLLLNFGSAAEEVVPTLKMLGDVSGGDQQKLDSLTLAFAQMSSAGRLMGQDLLQMINAGFNPLQVMSEKTGKSMGQLKKEMEKGAISSDMVKQAFRDATGEGGRFYQMLAKQSNTLEGLKSTWADIGDIALRTFGEQLVPTVKLFLSDLVASGDETINLGRAVGEFVAKSVLGFRMAYQQIAVWGAQIQALKFDIISSASEMASKIYGVFGNRQLASSAMQGAVDAKRAALTYQFAVGKIEGDLAKTREVYNNIGKQAALDSDNAKTASRRKAAQAQSEADKKASEESIKWLNDILTKAEEMEQAQKQARIEAITTAVSFAQSSVSQLSSIFQQYSTNQTMALDNEQTKRQTAIEEWYAEQEDQINNSVLTEKQRTKKLEALDEERARREQALNDDIDKKKRKIEYEAAKRAKVINITQSIMNTALGITNALARSGPPWVGIAMAAVIGALGAAQTAMIAAQPLPELAEGGVVQATRGGVPVITGEGGANELVAPLTPEVYENLAQNIVAAQGASSASASTLHVIFESGGIAVGEYVMKGTKNGTIKIDMRSLVKN